MNQRLSKVFFFFFEAEKLMQEQKTILFILIHMRPITQRIIRDTPTTLPIHQVTVIVDLKIIHLLLKLYFMRKIGDTFEATAKLMYAYTLEYNDQGEADVTISDLTLTDLTER